MAKERKVYLLICLSVCSFFLTGCMGAEYLVAYVPSLLQAGAGAVAGLENVDVKAAVSDNVSDEDLKKIKKIAVVIGTGRQTETNPQIPSLAENSDLNNIMSDNICLELMQLGYQVVERASLDKVLSEQKFQNSGITDTATAVKIGKIIGVDAIVLGYISTSQKTQMGGGFMGVGHDIVTAQHISDATMRIVGIEKGNIMMMVTLSYKKGQKPTEASKTMAIALSEKLKNPPWKKNNVGSHEQQIPIEKLSKATEQKSSIIDNAVTPQSTMPTKTVYVNKDSVSLRSGPGTNFKKIGSVTRGTKLMVIEMKQKWLKIRQDDGREGWIAEQFTGTEE